jgi:hypothetical protein
MVFTTDSSHLVSGTVVLNLTPPPDVFLKVMLGGCVLMRIPQVSSSFSRSARWISFFVASSTCVWWNGNVRE